MEKMMKRNGKPARIAKVIARSGLCSRREAERWIKAGRVSINGKVWKNPAFNIDTAEGVEVDGIALPVNEPMRVWRYHKPVGLLTTERDPEKRKTIFDLLPSGLPRVISVGRLDVNSEGLLLLTNDGELSRQFELPGMGWERHYRVRVFGRPQKDSLRALANGISVAGIRYAPIDVKLEDQSGANGWLTMTLREGKNREIRKNRIKLLLFTFENRRKIKEKSALFGGPYRNSHRQFFYSPIMRACAISTGFFLDFCTKVKEETGAYSPGPPYGRIKKLPVRRPPNNEYEI